jgi:lipopolysaccharide/colanic/teichoic acid biosynthesis glycosyltransferase
MYKYFKRVSDLIFSLLFLFIISPVFLTIFFLQVLFNGFPIFYLGLRTGKNNKEFKIYKFRTMVKNAELKGGFTTGKNDSRITKFGKMLRLTKLDEIPQLINIIKGDMSFVGPRPEIPFYTRQYSPEEKSILNVCPGITDYSSIKFINLDEEVGSENADKVYLEKIFKEKNILRLRYVREISFKTDMKIFLITIIKVFYKIITFGKIKKKVHD